MLNRESAVLVVVDFQTNLFQAMQGKDDLLANVLKIIKGAQAFEIPVLVAEQTPQKIGPTVTQVVQELKAFNPVSKETFSCWGNDYFRKKFEALNRSQVILIGIETHVCVYQTAVDLMGNGCSVYTAADGVSSRTRENCLAGIEAMKRAGAYITSAEMLLFELLRSAGDAKFRDIYKIVK